jgi:acyl dehydratase
MNRDKVISRVFPETEASYDFKDTILYALGIGFGAEPLDPRHLRYVFEQDLRAVPTMANVLGHPGFWAREPEYGIAWKKLLHAEQRLNIHAPLPAEGRIKGVHDIMGLRDKGDSGAMLYQRKKVINADTGELIASVVNSLMLRGDGGCGDHGDAPAELEKLPETPSATSAEVQSTEIQPLIYRLSGDLNPLHADPEVATAAGFPRPILHGLATKGLACYAILKTFCDLDASRLKSMALRFSRPVFPGDRIRFDFWQPTLATIRFRAVVADRDQTVLDRGTAEIEA